MCVFEAMWAGRGVSPPKDVDMEHKLQATSHVGNRLYTGRTIFEFKLQLFIWVVVNTKQFNNYVLSICVLAMLCADIITFKHVV